MDHALDKLEAMGEHLLYPLSERCQRRGIRELRPRGGRGPWRGFDARVGDAFVLLAVGAEAEADQQEFRRAVVAAEERLAELTP